MYTFWLAICPRTFRGSHWRWIRGLVAIVAVMDLLVSTKLFCSPKSDLTYLSMGLVCSHAVNFGPPLFRTNHVSSVSGAVGGRTYCEATNQVSQIGPMFSVVWC